MGIVKRTLIAAVVGAIVAAGAVVVGFYRIGPPPFAAANDLSTIVVDRDGKLLRAFTTKAGRWRLPVSARDVDNRYLEMLFAFEDKRFYRHGGVDAWGVARAAVQFVRNGRIVSGASTLTMQVARLLDGRHHRTAAGKISQMLRAWQIEARRSKPEILDLYLRLAPFGGNIEGARAASLAYFGKEPRRLSVGQAALLVALPQSPESRRPDRFATAAKKARDRVLDRAVAAGVLKPAEASYAKTERVPNKRIAFPMLAPHLAETVVSERADTDVHRLTIKKSLQRSLQDLARDHARLLGEKLSAAIIVADHKTGEVLAHVGASDYLDETRLGAIDMARAVRSPGSTLKPLIYGLGFELGVAHPETLIEDRPARFGGYAPKNFDNTYKGTMTVRAALQTSRNIPAVKVMERVGPVRFMGRLKAVGLRPELPSQAKPSLAISLGGVGLSLRDLTTLYAGLANGGRPVTLEHRRADGVADLHARMARQENALARPLLDPVAAWYVSDILKDAPPPVSARAGRIAYKTGTSYGYRDALAVGYDGRHTIAVWVGRADGTSTPGLLGRTAAAPILFDAFQRISERRAALGQAPAGVLNVSGGQLPPPLKRFGDEGLDSRDNSGFIEADVAIAFPPDRAVVALGVDGDDRLLLKAEGGVLPLRWLADGKPFGSDPRRRQTVWKPQGAGFVRLSVIDARGQSASSVVRLK